MAAHFHLPQVTESEVLRVLHLESRELWSRLWGSYDEAWADFFIRKMAAEEKYYLEISPGAVDLLRRLKKNGLGLGLATNRDRPWEALASVGLAPYFDTAVGALDVARGKPAPDMLLLALEQLRADPGQTLYIGDAPTDMAAAARAGLRGVGLLEGAGLDRADLLAAGAWQIRSTLPDLADLLG
jgi:HAD superfamily hydrolase (TIGR01509 family)